MNSYTISQNEIYAKQTMIDLLLADREQFRTQSELFLRQFKPRERKQLKGIETRSISAYHLLYSWKNELYPVVKQLVAKRTDKKFRAYMKKQLIVSNDELDAKIEQLIDMRINEVRTRFLKQLYSDSGSAYKNAQKLLKKTDEELDELLSRVISVTLSTIVASENGVAIVDGHASLLRRLRCHRKVRRERKYLRSSRGKRLAYIQQRKQELSNKSNGLFLEINEKGWDLITIISLRNQYEKIINGLPQKSAQNVVKRLAVFEEVTQKFRNDYIEKTNTANPKAGLGFAQIAAQEVDDLLLRIFDLSTTQKNQLLIHAKEYRELIEEQTEILLEDAKARAA